jgi:uncharacterized protein
MEKWLKRLENWFGEHDKVVVAFSGGVDSCLVAYSARHFLGKERTIAVISKSESLKRKDLDIAREFCRLYDIRLEEINTREIENPNYSINPTNRCYFCKTALYSMLDQMIADKYPGYTVLNGNNLSDLGDYRPGLEAAREHRVRSPLSECGIDKESVRALAKHFNLFTWDKPASPCLSSRFPYGESITLGKLRLVEGAENYLNELGFEDVRVRYYQNTAKIEVQLRKMDDLRNHFSTIRQKITAMGFDDCVIDEEGLVSGKLNRAIANVKQD